MEISKYKSNPKRRHSGFTLIAALFLLGLLVTVGVALVMVVLLEARQTMTMRDLATARANAKFAMQIAVHKLQETSGPDQRISAPSSVWKDSDGQPNILGQQHWTGIWHTQKRSWDGTTKKWRHEGRERDPYNGQWKRDTKLPTELQRQSWLVSGVDRKINGEWISPANANLHPDAVTLYDAASSDRDETGTPDIQPPDDVVVPAVHISGKDARDLSRYAYWVADEGTKSKVNFHEDPSQQYPNATSEEILNRLPLLSPRSNPLLDDPKARQLLTPDLLHVSDAEIDEDQALKHHYTSYSKGVLADMARGGLKKDLSRGLGDQFPEKLAGKVMWQEALPMRGPDGKILNLDVYQKKPELAVDENNAEQHRMYLRGPIWDYAQSWYNLYLPRPPFMPGFDGGIRKRLDPKYDDEPWLPKPADPVGSGDDPGLYSYSANTMQHGPQTSLQDTPQNSWIEARTGTGAPQHDWLFLTGHHSRPNFTDIPRWVHKERIDVNQAMYPKGPFYRREQMRHALAPILLETTVKLGFFAVDGAYLWDLQVREWRGSYWRYRCQKDNTPYDIAPKDWKVINPVDPMPVCPSCGQSDQMRFLNGFVGGSAGKFNSWGKPKDRRYPSYHLDRTKARRQLLEYLATDPRVRAALSDMGQGGISNAWRLMKHNGGPLDAEKHSMGLRNGNAVERAAYAALLDVFKLQMIIRPYLVYWNPYNVTLKNANPGLGFNMGNARGRFENGSLHLPDATIETSNGPLTFQLPQNRLNWKETNGFLFASAYSTRFVDTITNDFRRWYDTSVTAPNQTDFRPHDNDAANRAHFHNWNRMYFFCREPYDFAPGEIQIFTPILNQRTRDGNPTLVPGMEEGLKYTQPLTTRLLRRGESLTSLTYYSHPSKEYDLHGAHQNSWRMVTYLDKVNRDTSKKKHNGRSHLSILERIAPPKTGNEGVKIPINRTVESLVPRDYAQFNWWGTVMNGIADQESGHLREEQPRDEIGRRRAHRYRGPYTNGQVRPDNSINWGVPNEYIADVLDAITVQDDQYFYGCLSLQRSAADTTNTQGLPFWAQFNPRALSVLRNAETENTAFGWDAAILPLADAVSSGRINSAATGYPRWGPSYGPKGRQRLAMIDVPRQPMHSIIEFTNADLGKYQVAPTFATGNSYASPFIPPNQSYATTGNYNLLPSLTEKFRNDNHETHRLRRPQNLSIPDISYHLNKGFLDRYFLSTVPDISGNLTNSTLEDFKYSNSQFDPTKVPPFQTVDTEFVLNGFGLAKDESGKLVKSGKDPSRYALPNPRMKYHVPEALANDHTKFVRDYFNKLHDYDSAAAHLMVDGSFNVNSTSVEAWKQLLRSLKDKFQTDNLPFLRSLYPQGAANDAWEGFTALNEEQVEELAEALVSEVRLRGPFQSLADFVNRRLVDPRSPEPGQLPEHAYTGPLQAAIDKSINTKLASGTRLGEEANYTPKPESYWQSGTTYFEDHLAGKTNGKSVQGAGTPGWLLQSDVLRPLAPILNARSDTFLIRAYGDVGKNTRTQAKALCEAVVQRMPDYVHPAIHQPTDTLYGSQLKDLLWYEPDPSLIPGDPGSLDRDFTLKLDGDPSSIGTSPSAIRNRLRRENFKLGRRYKIINFRWL